MKYLKRPWLSIFCLAVLLAGCAFGPGAGTQLPNNILSERIRTQAVATAYAMLTAQASSAPASAAATSTPAAAPSASALPSASPIPSATAAPILPPASATAAQPTARDYPTFTSTPAQTGYTCSVVEIEPEAGKTFSALAAFDMVVRIKNTGSNAWDAGKILLLYTSGQKMQTRTSAVPLTSQVDVDGEFVFSVDMQAPEAPGTYKTTWALRSGQLFFCPVHFQVVVTK